MGDVESTCDRIVVLEGGQVVEDAEVSQLTQETETLYVEVDDRRDELLALLRGQGLEAGLDGISIVIETSMTAATTRSATQSSSRAQGSGGWRRSVTV